MIALLDSGIFYERLHKGPYVLFKSRARSMQHPLYKLYNSWLILLNTGTNCTQPAVVLCYRFAMHKAGQKHSVQYISDSVFYVNPFQKCYVKLFTKCADFFQCRTNWFEVTRKQHLYLHPTTLGWVIITF